MNNLKADAVLFLTRDGSIDRDRDAAKLLVKCEIEARHAEADDARGPSVDVLLHARPEVISEIKSGDAAGRLENAIRNSAPSPVRFLQWVEEGVSAGPRNESAIGDGSGSHSKTAGASAGERPRMQRDPSLARIPHGNEPKG